MGWTDKGIERLERDGLMVKEWGMEEEQPDAELRGWKGQGKLVQRDYEQRVRELWRRERERWEKEEEAVAAICELVAEADEEIERMRTEIGLLKGRGVRDGLDDVGVRGRLEWLRGKGIAGWLVEGEEE